MKTSLTFFFYLLLFCQDTKCLNHKRVLYGENVTLDCELDNKEIYWVFVEPFGSLVPIFRTFSSDSTTPFFLTESLKNKYSSKNLSRLFISNITKAELGFYYCVKADTKGLTFSNGTKLYTNEMVSQNKMEENDKLQDKAYNTTTTYSTLTLTSISMNVLLFITIIVLLMPKCRKPRQSSKPHQNVEEHQLEDLSAAEYSEIDQPTYPEGAQPSQINGTYFLLEKPKPDTRHTTR